MRDNLGHEAEIGALLRPWRPVRSMPIAFLSGIIRESLCMPPEPAARPTLGSGSAKVARSDATMMSQASAIFAPAPAATT